MKHLKELGLTEQAEITGANEIGHSVRYIWRDMWRRRAGKV